MTDQLNNCLPCDGIQVITPRPVYNRPGLDALKYRIGTHSSFFESLLARISTLTAEELAELSLSVNQRVQQRRNRKAKSPSKTEHPLRDWLTTREKNDPAIAMLDAWSVVADVLTFYQERIANEGFLRTAQERRSIQELARLTGYRLRPGVSSTVYLAFEVEDTNTTIPFGNAAPSTQSSTPILIPKGTAVKSTPAPGTNEEPQTFETSRDLLARQEWNAMRPRQSKPQLIVAATLPRLERLYLNGIGLRLAANDVLAFLVDDSVSPTFFQVQEVTELPSAKTTVVRFTDNPLRMPALIRNIHQVEVQLYDSMKRRLTREKWHSLTTAFAADIQRSVTDARAKSLIDADQHLVSELVCKVLASPGSTPPPPSIVLDSANLLSVATTVTGTVTTPLLDAVETFRRTVVDLYSSHSLAFNCLATLHESLESLPATTSFTLPDAARADAALRLSLGAIRLGSAHPITVIGAAGSMTATMPTVAMASSDKIQLPVSVNSIGTDSMKFGAKVTIAAKSANANVGLGDALAQEVSFSNASLQELNQQLNAVFIDTNNPLSADILVEARDHSTNEVLDVVSLHVTRDNVNETRIKPNRSPLKYVTGPLPVAGDVVVEGANFDMNWACRLSCRLVSTGDKLSIDGVTREQVTIEGKSSGQQFEDALKRVQLVPNPQATRPFQVVLIEFFPDGILTTGMANTPVVAMTRHIYFVDGPTSSFDAAIDRIAQSISDVAVEPEAAVTRTNAVTLSLDIATAQQSSTALEGFLSSFPATPASATPDSKIIADTSTANATTLRTMSSSLPSLILSPLQACATACDKATTDFPSSAAVAVESSKTIAESLAAGQSETEIAAYLRGDLTDLLQTLGTDLRPSGNGINDAIAKCTIFDSGLSDLPKAAERRYGALLDDIRQFAARIQKELVSVRTEFIRQVGEILKSFRQSSTLVGIAEIDVFLDELETVRKEFEKDVVDLTIDDNSCANCTAETKTLADAFCFVIKKTNKQGSSCTCDLTICSSMRPLQEDHDSLRSRMALLTDQLVQLPPPLSDLQQDPDELDVTLERFRQLARAGGNSSISASRDLGVLLAAHSDLISQLVGILSDGDQELLTEVLRSYSQGAPALKPRVFVMRSQARVFGWNSPEFISPKQDELPYKPLETGANGEAADRLYLDNKYDGVKSGDIIAIQYPGVNGLRGFFIERTSTRPRTAYGLSGECLQLELRGSWWNPANDSERITNSRNTRVYCEAQELELAEEPVSETNILNEGTTEIELNEVHVGLRIDQPLVLEGVPDFVELTAVKSGQSSGSRTVHHSARIVSVKHRITDTLFGDRFRTQITLSDKLPYNLYSDTIRIYANVVEATHGDTQREVLGSGDGAKEFQKFLLKRPEVSQIVTPNERGIQSTLVVKVNDVDWNEKESLREATEQQEAFVSQTNDAQQMTVVFGDGVNGARLPTGLENVRAEYRTGLGRKGNVAGGQINQLLGAPLGVKKVNNPLAAKGGADPESRELAREHAPLAVTAMDRLVSVQDYEDFARTYAGIGKASASMIQGTVHVTIAGLDPEPLDADNPIFNNLMHAFGIFGDPSQSFELHSREASLLIIVAKIKIDRRYEWQHVQPKIRTALLELFHYDRRDLGQDVLLSDAIATMQCIEGVSYVDVDQFDAVRQQDVSKLASRLSSIQRRPRVHVNLARLTSNAGERAALGFNEVPETVPTSPATNPGDSANNKPADTPKLRPAELCYLTPDIPDTLILELIP
jgi:hypothetical protein